MPHILTRSLLVIALVFQSLLPATLAAAEARGVDVSAFICNPAQSGPSDEATAHIQDLLTALGEMDQAPAPNTGHCDNCVMPVLALASPPHILTPAAFTLAAPIYFWHSPADLYPARGPPLGGRAPPVSL